MSQPRNLVAAYRQGRSALQVERMGRALAAVSPLRPVPAAAGWLVAVDAPAGAEACNGPSLFSVEGAGALERALMSASARELVSDAALRALPGEVAFCALGEHGAFSLVRSCGGLVPLYYHLSEQGVCIATRLRDLFWLCGEELKVDPLVHAAWAAGNAFFPDERTFFRGAKVLPRGHVLRVTAGRVRVEPYWDPRPDELREPAAAVVAEHALELKQLLLRSLDEGLSRTRSNLLTLSGGVDSSAVAVLSARHLERPLQTLTFVAPRASKARAVQLSFVEPLLQDLRVASPLLVDAENSVLDELFASPLGTLYHCPHPALRLLPKLAGAGVETLVSGHFADELCGYSQRRQDWVRHTRLAALFEPHWPPSYGVRDALRWGKRRALEALGRPLLPLPKPLGRLFVAEVRHELAEWIARTRARMLGDRRPLRELAAWTELDGWVAMHWEVASVHGVRPVHPFFNRAALELGFRCHPSELFGPGTKKILRRALSGLVPDQYLARQDKGHWRRPPRTERTCFSDQLRGLSACVDPRWADGRTVSLTIAEHRQLTQLALFGRALVEAASIRGSIQRGLD